MEKKEQKRRSLNNLIDEAIASSDDISVAGIDTNSMETQEGRGVAVPQEAAAKKPVPTGMAAEKACFLTLALPESVKRVIDMKVRYDSKELPAYNQTLKHIGRRWFLRGLLAEGLITEEQFNEASALHSEYGWERDKVREQRRRT